MLSFLQKRIFGNLILTFGTSTVLQGVAIITGILTARLLGPTGKGQLTAIIIWPAMLSLVGSLGLAEAINYFTASNENLKGKVLASGLYVGIVQTIVLVGIGWLLTPLVLQRQGEEMILLGRYYLLFIPLNLFTQYLQSYLAGKLRFAPYNLVRLTVSGVILVGLVVLAIAGSVTVVNVLIVYLVANAITLLIAAANVYQPRVEGFIPDGQLARPMLAYGLKAHASSVTLLVNERLDQLIIAMFLPAIELGYYAAAVSLTTGVLVIGTSIAMVAMPVVAKKQSMEEQVQDISRFFRINLWLSIAVAALFMVVLHYLILILFGVVYLPAENAARVLLLAAIPLSGNRVLQASLKAVNMPLQAGMAELIAAVLTVLLLSILIPTYGILGAAITSFLAYLISGMYMLVIIIKKMGLSIAKLFLPTFSDYQYGIDLLRAVGSTPQHK